MLVNDSPRKVQGLGEIKTKAVIVLQHPCALRFNGVDLHSRLMVAELRNHKVIPVQDWTGHVGKMPMPELIPDLDTRRRHQAAFFDELCLVGPADLSPGTRIACLSQTGVNLLLQRWVHHNSRMVAPTITYQEVSSPAYEEADLIEEWCEKRGEAGLRIQEATVEAIKWLREDTAGGITRQRMLENPQHPSTVRRQMRTALRQFT